MYKSKLSIIETEKAIKLVKDTFERELAKKLNLVRISSPLFVRSETGLNDDLNGTERAVEFDMKYMDKSVQIIHSLAKWKRYTLQRYGFNEGNGIYTDMNAIRRDEDPDELHSIYVDQWDWEKIIAPAHRNMDFLYNTVQLIVDALLVTQEVLHKEFPILNCDLRRKVFFITSQELEYLYPNDPPKERENKIAQKHGIVFVSQIGGLLESGKPHDGRAPDYDDWNLNGDILVWYPVLNKAVEISSMGIRVDAKTLDEQLECSGCNERRELEFHKMLLESRLPLTIGGGIGQSRICMILLDKVHIGEVQASVWPSEMVRKCEESNIYLL